jgi:hypothetical protein
VEQRAADRLPMGAAFELFARDGRRVLSAFAHTLVDDPASQ